MSIQKQLCLICECPTADGAVLAVQVDKEKLQNWFLNLCGHELSEDIEDDDLICYFCLWHAKFQCKFDEIADENLVWWNLDLDDAARELRNNYFEGNLEQCWVLLEKIEIPKSADGEERRIVEAEIGPRQWKCIYCGKKLKYSHALSRHIKKLHNDVIRCENRSCVTYFHTHEEKEEHNKNVHEESKEQEKFMCSFCQKEFEGPQNYNLHVRQVHQNFPVKCSRYGCLSFFKTKIEMKTHFDSAHGKDDMAKMFKCNDCDYKAMQKGDLGKHIACKHLPKYIRCKKCKKMYSTESSLKRHVNRIHKFKVCRFCKSAVTIDYMKSFHLKIKQCSHCKSKFQCRGLYKSHLKSCRKVRFNCAKCSKSFNFKCHLADHTRKKH